MKDIRIGNDITIQWSLFNGDAQFPIEGLDLHVYLKDKYGRKEIEDFQVSGNQITWTFYGKDQRRIGVYSMEVVINEGEEGMITTDACQFVNLVPCSCSVKGSDPSGVQTETIEITSVIEIGNSNNDPEIKEELARLEREKADKQELTELSAEISKVTGNVSIVWMDGFWKTDLTINPTASWQRAIVDIQGLKSIDIAAQYYGDAKTLITDDQDNILQDVTIAANGNLHHIDLTNLNGASKLYISNLKSYTAKVEFNDTPLSELENIQERLSDLEENAPSAKEEIMYLTNAGYIAQSTGKITGTNGTWKHSNIIPIEQFVSAGPLVLNASVASVAFFSTDEISEKNYVGGYQPTTKMLDKDIVLTASAAYSNAKYLVISSDSNASQMCEVTYQMLTETGVLSQKIGDLSELATIEKSNLVKAINEVKQEQSNIAKYVHFSLDDSTFWVDLIENENTYSSCFENSVLSKLKELHEEYGFCFTLNCLTRASDKVISDAPSKFAAEFSVNKDWLRFSFHGTEVSEIFTNTNGETLKEYYDEFVAAIYNMTGTYECVDRVARLSSFTGNAENIKAIRDTECGIVGLLTTDRNIGLSVGHSYALSSEEDAYMHNHCKMYKAEQFITYIRSMTRLESTTYAPSLMASAAYANYRPMVELFWHETAAWQSNYFLSSILKPWFDWMKENGYKNGFAMDLLNL